MISAAVVYLGNEHQTCYHLATESTMTSLYPQISLLIIAILHLRQGDTLILFVTPSVDVPCPRKPCLTLSQYTEDQSNFFNGNVELHFLPGVHNLTDQLVIEGGTNVTTFTLIGSLNNQSKILSSGQAAIIVNEIQTVRIESLYFCGSNNLTVRYISTLILCNLYLTTVANGHGFIFENIENVTAKNISILKSYNFSSGMTFRSSNGDLFNIHIQNNVGNFVFIIEQSTIHFRTFIVQNNTADKSSVLLIMESKVKFDDSTRFCFNTCKCRHGSMSIVKSNVSLRHQVFISSNNAKEGGAMYLDNSDLVLQDSVDITNNSAGLSIGNWFGGAIKSIKSTITMEGQITFTYNRVVSTFGVASGGAINLDTSQLKMTGIIKFHHNFALNGLVSVGGAICINNSTIVAADVNITFWNNSAINGGAIAASNSVSTVPLNLQNTIIVEGDSFFDSNKAENVGGAMYGDGLLDIKFNGNTTLTNNDKVQVAIMFISQANVEFSGITEIKHSTNSAIIVQNNATVIFCGVNRFVNNSRSGHDDVIGSLAWSSYIFAGATYFEGNGGAIAVLGQSSSLVIMGRATFIDNDSGISAVLSNIKLEGHLRFIRNKGTINGCINLYQSNMTINGTLTMNENTATFGPAITSFQSRMYMIGDNYIISNNTATDVGGSIYAQGSEIHIQVYNCTYLSNVANRGGAIYATYSSIYLSGHQTFNGNKATTGGAISLGLLSVMYFNDLEIMYENNKAQKGAIIYVEDYLSYVDCSTYSVIPPISLRSDCFYKCTQNCKVVHSGNQATFNVGSILFGGNLKRCNRQGADKRFMNLFNSSNSIKDISSDPYQIAFCDQGRIQSPYVNITIIDTVPGKSFSVFLAGLNQLDQPVDTTVRANIPADLVSNFTASLGRFESKQGIKNKCTELKYHLFTRADTINLTLYAQGPCNTLGTASRTVSVKLRPCPDGFQLAGEECTCTAALLKYTSVCNIDNETIRNSGNFWASGLYTNGSYQGIMSFSHCPFDYCKGDTVYFTLNEPDSQCDHNRSGIICGQCKVNYSLTFGEGECLACSENRLITFGLIVLFAVLGIILVVLLTMLKLTVVTGTLNGLIFYANIIDASRDIFIPQVGWARTFISWLNLDFGFTVCFYKGMDTYTYTWMQFLFPFYIWALIGVIIVVSRYSVWMTKRVGSNPIAVLATLILLSYTKLLRTVISVFYFAVIQLPNSQTLTVWLYDGNVHFLHSKHLALFVFALFFFALVFIPYNLLLVFGPWLRRVSGVKDNESKVMATMKKALLGWYEDFRIKMLFDAYTIPYNEGYHYWTGVLLMLRCVLLLVFASSSFRNSSTTILAVAMVILGAAFLARLFTGRIYKSWFIDILEAVFLLNLGVLSVATYHNMLTEGNQQMLANISVGISFALSVGIVLYHAVTQVVNTNLFKALYRKVKFILFNKYNESDEQQPLPDVHDTPDVPLITYISIPASTDTDYTASTS